MKTANDEAHYLASSDSLTGRLSHIHTTIGKRHPAVDRVACALYDSKTDLLKTFFNSTLTGDPIKAYDFPLANSQSLSELAHSGDCRAIDLITDAIAPGRGHSDWVREQGYRSSFTVPMKNGNQLLGFIFFDSFEPGMFEDRVQRDLLLYCNLITMAVVSELNAVACLMATVQAAREFVGLRDFETGAHLNRMARISHLIARGVAEHYQLDDEFVEHIYLFAPLHDIGKIGIPDRILLKVGKLEPDEWEIMKSHVIEGERILHTVLEGYQLGNMMDSRMMINIVSGHHELLDGSGYPKRLMGEHIPIEARIVTVADIFDALTSERPYKHPWPIDEAINELQRMVAAGKLDGHCVNALVNQRAEAEHIVTTIRDAAERGDTDVGSEET
ncbi:HD domain-containing phosphohydrolase [Oceanobacter mangrovi]|uniref:HD domain-containing phosphohydrolase n=1 Tax=Oceanobacter mangrovi TaxID=2862510 RepID=UPI001C8D8B12|nr:HD domain-containing phosphohydrolase [Oceanobacter mangrovi]